MILLLLGPPGAGKGTQGERLAARLGIPKIATGDVLRAALRAGTPLGLEAKAAMDRGALVPDSVIMGIMQEALAAPDAANGAILDGVVRTTPQAEGLAAMLATLGTPLDAVLLFEVDEEELVRRLSGRTTCDACQRPYLPARWCAAGTTSRKRSAPACRCIATRPPRWWTGTLRTAPAWSPSMPWGRWKRSSRACSAASASPDRALHGHRRRRAPVLPPQVAARD
jgi:adenylate kinase